MSKDSRMIRNILLVVAGFVLAQTLVMHFAVDELKTGAARMNTQTKELQVLTEDLKKRVDQLDRRMNEVVERIDGIYMEVDRVDNKDPAKVN
ncbi:MAG: hypothetical protein EOP83_34840, partial [Verrucomicrobiaceae bacterium]